MKKSVLIVMNTMGRAGAERALIAMLKKFDYENFEVSLLSIIGRGEMFAEVPSEVKILNEDYSALPVLDKAGMSYLKGFILKRLFSTGYIFKFALSLAKAGIDRLKGKSFQLEKLMWYTLAKITPPIEKEYDLAVAYIEGASTYYVSDRIKAKKKAAFVRVNYTDAGYRKDLDLPYYEKIDRIFCVSEALKLKFLEVYPEYISKTVSFPSIMIPEEIKAQAEESGGFEDDFEGLRLLTVGRLHSQKGIDVAIKAFAKLLEMGYKNIRWYVLGEGPDRAELEKMIKHYKLENYFFLPGSVGNPYPYVKQCDIYIQPSRFEGWGRALFEALLLSRPSITTDFDGVPGILKNGQDALIISLSEENLVNSVKRLIDNPAEREALSIAAGKIKVDFMGVVRELYDMMN